MYASIEYIRYIVETFFLRQNPSTAMAGMTICFNRYQKLVQKLNYLCFVSLTLLGLVRESDKRCIADKWDWTLETHCQPSSWNNTCIIINVFKLGEFDECYDSY